MDGSKNKVCKNKYTKEIGVQYIKDIILITVIFLVIFYLFGNNAN